MESNELLDHGPNTSYGAAGSDRKEPVGQALYTRDVDREALARARNLLIFVAVLAFLFIVVTLIGGVLSYSISLIVNSTAIMVVFSRVMFLAFLLQCAGRPTSRLAQYRRYKIELFMVLSMLLVSWLVVGGGIFMAIEDLLLTSYGVTNDVLYIVIAGCGVLFAVIVLVVMLYGKSVVPKHRMSRAEMMLSPPSNKIAPEMPQYARERGLLLRRTLKHVPMQPYTLMTLWFSLQCVLVLAASIVLHLEDGYEEWDVILGLCFVPFTIIWAGLLLRDVLNVMSEGILQGLDFSEVVESLLTVDGVTRVHDLRIWALTMDRVSLSVTLTVERGSDIEDILNKASAMLKSKYDVFEYKIDTARERMGGNATKMWPTRRT